MTSWPEYDEDEDDSEEPVSCFPPVAAGGDRRPRVLTEQCVTCIYRPGNKMHLRAGRLREMTDMALRQGCQGVICHDTLHRSDGYLPALCRGFYDKFGPQNNFIRVAWRLGGFAEVSPPPVEAGDSTDAR
jgi:hypothetical protein